MTTKSSLLAMLVSSANSPAIPKTPSRFAEAGFLIGENSLNQGKACDDSPNEVTAKAEWPVHILIPVRPSPHFS